MEYYLAVKITNWSDGFTNDIKGCVHYMDPISDEFRIETQSGDFHRIAFEDVIGVVMVDCGDFSSLLKSIFYLTKCIMRMKTMSVSIRIDYKTDSLISQSATFPFKGRKSEQVALQWWKQLKKQSSYRAILEKVTANEQDITQLVKDLEKKEWENAMKDNLPF